MEREAEKAKEDAAQPELPAFAGKSSGLISSSAFAFGSLGMGGGSVAEKQLDIQRKTWEDARKRDEAERENRKELVKLFRESGVVWTDVRDLMKKMQIFGAT